MSTAVSALEAWWQALPLSKQARLKQELRQHLQVLSPLGRPNAELEPVPWLLPEPHWKPLQAAIFQRHRLLSLILHDVYTEQSLLKSGDLPAQEILSSPLFQLPCFGLKKHPQEWLPLLSTQCCQDKSGQFYAIGDSHQPYGLGLILQHRLAFNQLSLASDLSLDRLHLVQFFRQLKQLLLPEAAESNQSGLLSLGKKDTHHAELSFLASYLTIPLVQPADLMFKEGAMHLKTVTGLRRLTSLCSVLEDAKSDSLELSSLGPGPAGLLQSLRNDTLLLINPPGAGLVKHPLLNHFLPTLCQKLLNEPLALPCISSRWGAEESLVGHLKDGAQLYQLSLHQTFDWGSLLEKDKAALLGALEQNPRDFLVLELPPLHTEAPQLPSLTAVPSGFTGKGLSTGLSKGLSAPSSTVPNSPVSTPQHPNQASSLGPHEQKTATTPTLVYRQVQFYSLLKSKDGIVLPSGLASLHRRQEHLFQRAQTEHYQEVWFEGKSSDQQSLWQAGHSIIRPNRSTGVLPSRVADHLFWLGRYNERLNLMCRVMRQLVQMNLVEGELLADDCQRLLSFCLYANGIATNYLSQEPSKADLKLRLAELCDPNVHGSLPSTLQSLLFNAQSVREYFSESTWYVLENLQRELQLWPVMPRASSLVRRLDQLILLQTAIYGMASETMTRTIGLTFLQAGQYLERSLQMAHLLNLCFCQHSKSISPSLQEALLRLTDTQVTYRRRYPAKLYPLAVLDLLLLDESTPRSVSFSLAQLSQLMTQMPTTPKEASALQIITHITQVMQAQAEQLLEAGLYGSSELEFSFSQLQQQLRQLSEHITLCYFSHAEPGYSWQSF